VNTTGPQSPRRPHAAAKRATPRLVAENAYLGFINRLHACRSVVEFGCGLATWLRVAREVGATEIHGYDTSDLPLSARGLTSAEFSSADLGKFIKLERKFDLAVCLELAQQLPARAGSTLVKTLCAASDWVLFSAAMPCQGGTGNQNENWMEYWARHFSENGFKCYDILREKFWYDAQIPFYLRQNACLYVRQDADQELSLHRLEPVVSPLSQIHPELYLKLLHWLANRRKGVTDAGAFTAELRAFYQETQVLARADGTGDLETAQSP